MRIINLTQLIASTLNALIFLSLATQAVGMESYECKEFPLEPILQKMSKQTIELPININDIEEKSAKITSFLIHQNPDYKKNSNNYKNQDQFQEKISKTISEGRDIRIISPCFATKSQEQTKVLEPGTPDLSDIYFVYNMLRISNEVSKIHPCKIVLASDGEEVFQAVKLSFGSESNEYQSHKKLNAEYHQYLKEIIQALLKCDVSGDVEIIKTEYQSLEEENEEKLDKAAHKLTNETVIEYANGFAKSQFPKASINQLIKFAKYYLILKPAYRINFLKTYCSDDDIYMKISQPRSLEDYDLSLRIFIPHVPIHKSIKEVSNFQHAIPVVKHAGNNVMDIFLMHQVTEKGIIQNEIPYKKDGFVKLPGIEQNFYSLFFWLKPPSSDGRDFSPCFV